MCQEVSGDVLIALQELRQFSFYGTYLLRGRLCHVDKALHLAAAIRTLLSLFLYDLRLVPLEVPEAARCYVSCAG